MKESGYIEILRENRDFRRFWFANIISMIGEWFNLIALFVLIDLHTGSAFTMAHHTVLLSARLQNPT